MYRKRERYNESDSNKNWHIKQFKLSPLVGWDKKRKDQEPKIVRLPWHKESKTSDSNSGYATMHTVEDKKKKKMWKDEDGRLKSNIF